jgi:hypothetical protein
MIALSVGQAEHPLLQDGVLSVPEGQREAKAHVLVTDTGDAILTPAVGS